MFSSSRAFEIAHQAAMYLADLMDTEGKFRYRFKVESGESLSGYNVLRHAGTIWAMLDVYRDTRTSHLLESSRRGVTFMLNSFLRYFQDYTNCCICEDNKIKLGGNALASLVLINLHEITKDLSLLFHAENLCNFMVTQRTETGEMIHKRYFTSGKISQFRSMYYTGEALLALLSLHQHTNNQKWLEIVKDMESNLMLEEYGVKEQSHWMLYFLGMLSQVDTSTEIYLHARKTAQHIISFPDYLHWNRSTPIACRSEGLLAFLQMNPPADYDDREFRDICLHQVSDNLERQTTYMREKAFIRGGGDRRNDEVRIDYIQHNVSSFLHFYRLCKNFERQDFHENETTKNTSSV